MEFHCPGLPAKWINSWLAAVGSTVLNNSIQLSWDKSRNCAVLTAMGADPLEMLAASWPCKEELERIPIAEHWHETSVLNRNVNVDAFAERARAARKDPRSWALSSTMTDLAVDKNGEVAHARFDPPGPGTVKWLHHRLMKSHSYVDDISPDRLQETLMGKGDRFKNNGLGFDQTRLGSMSDKSDIWTDPVIEVLAFFGLAILPMRGSGSDLRLTSSSFSDERQRGWARHPDKRSLHFRWPAWEQFLDTDGIDALLDIWKPERKYQWPLLGVHAAWQTVEFQRKAKNDPTRAFGSECL